ELKELLPLEALGILDGEDARAMTAHLAERCDECSRELVSLRETVAALGFADGDVAVRPRVAQLLEQRLAAADGGSNLTRLGAVQELRRWRTLAVGAVAAALLLGLTIVTSLHLQRELVQLRAQSSLQMAALRLQIDNLRSGISSASAQIDLLNREISANRTLALAAYLPGTSVLRLKPLEPAPDAAGVIVVSQNGGSATLDVRGLAPAPPGRVYEAWWIGVKSGPTRAGTFQPGSGIALIPPPRTDRVVLSAVTLEPSGGVDKPTGAMYLRGDFPQ
ncbi:MAG TPA: anti-sigma factor, partial [Candidatus Binataceae bacterium]|nr:anti-sigma factor [Candidatus Binataceae bacterium]